MELNSDFDQRIVRHGRGAVWTPSPLPGVDRRMRDRIGGEVARATSIVRYAADSRFDRHVHEGGEEILVLDGVFSDERGDYPAGTYVRNPPGTSHASVSRGGCTLFVKLWQSAADDTERVHVDTSTAAWHPGLVPALSVMPPHEHDGLSAALVRWAPQTRFDTHADPGGEEILALDGVFSDEHDDYLAGTWLRNPRGNHHTPYTGAEGALIYVKVWAIGEGFMTIGA